MAFAFLGWCMIKVNCCYFSQMIWPFDGRVDWWRLTDINTMMPLSSQKSLQGWYVKNKLFCASFFFPSISLFCHCYFVFLKWRKWSISGLITVSENAPKKSNFHSIESNYEFLQVTWPRNLGPNASLHKWSSSRNVFSIEINMRHFWSLLHIV